MVRRGATIIEMSVAGAMLAAMLVVCLQMLTAVAAQRTAVDRQRYAAVELANAMERIAARPWAELTPEALADQQPSPAACGQLPGAELKVEISVSPAEPDAKRIAVSLRWHDRAGKFLPPITITTWKYRIELQNRKRL